MDKLIEHVYRTLSGGFKGTLLRSGDAGYGEATQIWNGMFSRRPGLFAFCRDVRDVQAAVRVAATSGVLTAVRCGGHSLAGFSTCDQGLVIDLSPMREVRVDPEARRAHFSGGCLLGNVDAATQKVALAFPAGVVSHTGAAGLVLGGGTGWLNRLHGLSCDNVEGFTLVVADGTVLRANTNENSDLFWALRGGGGNFGVVYEFELRLHPVTSVLFGKGMALGQNIPRAVQQWRDFMPEAPDELRWGFSLRVAPDTESTSTRVRGLPVASASALWVGDLEKGRRYVDQALATCDPSTVSKEILSF